LIMIKLLQLDLETIFPTETLMVQNRLGPNGSS